MLQSLKPRLAGKARMDIREALSVATVMAAAAAILVLACTAPRSPSDAVQASLVHRLVTSL